MMNFEFHEGHVAVFVLLQILHLTICIQIRIVRLFLLLLSLVFWRRFLLVPLVLRVQLRYLLQRCHIIMRFGLGLFSLLLLVCGFTPA